MKPRKPRTRKPAAPKGTCGADPSSSLFPEQAPAGCVLVRARALSQGQGQAEAVAVTPAARIALVILRVRPGAVALAVAAPVVPP